jgi:hypothetical protein
VLLLDELGTGGALLRLHDKRDDMKSRRRAGDEGPDRANRHAPSCDNLLHAASAGSSAGTGARRDAGRRAYPRLYASYDPAWSWRAMSAKSM